MCEGERVVSLGFVLYNLNPKPKTPPPYLFLESVGCGI